MYHALEGLPESISAYSPPNSRTRPVPRTNPSWVEPSANDTYQHTQSALEASAHYRYTLPTSSYISPTAHSLSFAAYHHPAGAYAFNDAGLVPDAALSDQDGSYTGGYSAIETIRPVPRYHDGSLFASQELYNGGMPVSHSYGDPSRTHTVGYPPETQLHQLAPSPPGPHDVYYDSTPSPTQYMSNHIYSSSETTFQQYSNAPLPSGIPDTQPLWAYPLTMSTGLFSEAHGRPESSQTQDYARATYRDDELFRHQPLVQNDGGVLVPYTELSAGSLSMARNGASFDSRSPTSKWAPSAANTDPREQYYHHPSPSPEPLAHSRRPSLRVPLSPPRPPTAVAPAPPRASAVAQVRKPKVPSTPPSQARRPSRLSQVTASPSTDGDTSGSYVEKKVSKPVSPLRRQTRRVRSSQSPTTVIPSESREGSAESSSAAKRRATEKRPFVACLFCRGRKIACAPIAVKDGEEKRCNQCARRRIKCTYPTTTRRTNRKSKRL